MEKNQKICVRLSISIMIFELIFFFYLEDKSFYNPTSNQNLDQIRCYIQNQNIIHQNPSPQYPFDEPPIINLSLNPVLAYPIMSPPQPNFSYNFNFQAPNPYPNQLPFTNNPFLINNFPNNNGYYNFPMQMNNDPNYFSPNFPQMMYPQEPMNFSNDFQQINFNNGNFEDNLYMARRIQDVYLKGDDYSKVDVFHG